MRKRVIKEKEKNLMNSRVTEVAYGVANAFSFLTLGEFNIPADRFNSFEQISFPLHKKCCFLPKASPGSNIWYR